MLIRDQEIEKAFSQIHFGTAELPRIKFSDAFDKHYRNVWRHGTQADWYLQQRAAILAGAVEDFYLDEVKDGWCSAFIDKRMELGSLNPSLNTPRSVGKITVNHNLQTLNAVLRSVDGNAWATPQKQKKASGDSGY